MGTPGPQTWRSAFALAVGTLGGWLALRAALPLPWMIGPMLATTAAALAGAPIQVWTPLRTGFVTVLGVMLGSAFTPAILDRLNDWVLSLVILALCTGAAGLLGMLYFRAVAGYDRATSYFAAMPGGLSEMILVGEAMGGDARAISLTHAARLLLVIFVLPFAFQLLLGYDPAARPSAGPDVAAVPPGDLAILVACALAGYAGARALAVPAAAVTGPMLLSAAVHLGGLTHIGPPNELVAAAQVVVGSHIGSRFAGTPAADVARAVFWAVGGTAVLLGATLAFALAARAATGLDLAALTLAYAPGGLAEMSLVALALGIDAAFVGTHHIVRIFLIVVFAPLVFRLRPPAR